MYRNSKPPVTLRRFANSWAELDYLCKKVRYWLYTRKRKTGAAHYRRRLERVLREVPHNDVAILREEGQALLCELKGEWRDAITHRDREIRLMQKLQRDAQSSRYTESTRAYMLRDRDGAVLRDRLSILEALKKKAGMHIGNLLGKAQ